MLKQDMRIWGFVSESFVFGVPLAEHTLRFIAVRMWSQTHKEKSTWKYEVSPALC